MKSFYIRAGQNQNGISRASEVKFRSAAIIHTMEIADRECGIRAFSVVNYELRPHKNIRHAIRGSSFRREMRDGFSQNQKLQTRFDRKLDGFGQAVPR